MPSESLHSETAARNAALSRLREEHRALARVTETLETLTAQVVDGHSAPDFALLSSLLYYVDAVPERLHHPKEERYLFAALRERSVEAVPLIERLHREHERSPHVLGELERALVHWQGGACDGLQAFALGVARFCEFTWTHMRTEETVILPLAERCLTDTDWMSMAEAFGANGDPLFGLQRRAEFDRLYRRIADLAPHKLKLTRPAREAPPRDR